MSKGRDVQLLELDSNKAAAVVVLTIIPSAGIVLARQRRVLESLKCTRHVTAERIGPLVAKGEAANIIGRSKI